MPEFLLRGQRAGPAALAPLADLLNRPGGLEPWGGLLWRWVWNPALEPAGEWLDCPVLDQGERRYHHELRLSRPEPRGLAGSVSARGDWLITAAVPARAWTAEAQAFVAGEARALALLWRQAGLGGPAPLDPASGGFLGGCGFSEPRSLWDLL